MKQIHSSPIHLLKTHPVKPLMSDRVPPSEELIAEVERLRQEVNDLKAAKTAFEAQDELVRSLVSMGQAATGRLMLRSMLLQMANIASKLSQAEECSLFLLNPEGLVTESILARGATIREYKENLIGQVLDKGLAGWVVRNRQIASVADTLKDERWLTLPNQPYRARSALCIPLLRGKVLLGLMTLTHPQPSHFRDATIQLLKMCATQMALVLDNARLYVRENSPTPIISTASPQPVPLPATLEPLAKLGVYIIDDRGKFLYANNQLASIFDYPFADIASMESVLVLVTPSDYEFVADKLNYCLNGHAANLSFRFKGQKRRGEIIAIEVEGQRTTFYGKPVVIGVLRAIPNL
jgi:PAS domain S-box-containing protein